MKSAGVRSISQRFPIVRAVQHSDFVFSSESRRVDSLIGRINELPTNNIARPRTLTSLELVLLCTSDAGDVVPGEVNFSRL